MTKTEPEPRASIAANDAETQSQIDDYERYRSAELKRYFALVKVAGLQSSNRYVDDDSAIVRGTD